ncbi:MAG TPA: efflux RND transporter periplasmic adaptor subunit [Limnobacter sp.]|uniref:efflux RND transporter periplasmic adaptor subunit n=1 Tax=Limnobacter sp. TaxID=2003368 RepID=UPI002ED7E154
MVPLCPVKPWLLMAALALSLTACSRSAPDTSEVIRPVRVMALKADGTESEDTFPAQIEPRYSASLSFQVGGRLIARLADVGDRVKKGQVLARVDPQDLKLALQAAQAQFAAANTEYLQNKTDLARFKTLREQNFISQAELDRRQLALDAAESRLTQARAQLNVQQNQAQYSELKAPNDGVISQVLLDAGQVVAPGQPVLQWANEKAVQVRMAVPEGRVKDIRDGQVAVVDLWSIRQQLKATVREVGPVADPITRTYPVYLDLTQSAPDARFGMSATVRFAARNPDVAFKLPVAALVAEATGAFVWVFDEAKGEVHRRPVKPYDVNETSFLVKDGLKDGELVVTAGTHTLSEGQKARRFIETADLAKKAKALQDGEGGATQPSPGSSPEPTR